jgi:arsenite-transporting ATPase
MSRLLEAAGDARFTFVVGKGGVGKTTTAGALALELADGGQTTRIISTDPAHSLHDLFRSQQISPCGDRLVIEQFDAAAHAQRWLAHALAPVSAIFEAGTYLDSDDVRAFSQLALPGVDELMAVLRLTDLAEGTDRIVVDTAPTGHTLRLLDAAATHASLADALRAMAAKASAVASAFTGARADVAGAAIIDELDAYVRRYRTDVLGRARFVVAARADRVVEAETDRLLGELRRRSLETAALVWTGARGTLRGAPPVELAVPLLEDAGGCDGLRAWRAALAPAAHVRIGHRHDGAERQAAQPFAGWLAEHAPRLLLFAGKGGVGKSTCAAAAALVLARSRSVLLCSADPAGSLYDVLAGGEYAEERLRVLQIEPASQFGRMRAEYRADIEAALERIGLSQSAALDRRVIEALWDLAPPGIDELAATAAMLDAARDDETVVLDTAPTGHFLRLLETPELALSWTRQLMRVVVKYGIAGVAEGAAESLLRLARELKALTALLHDPQRTAAVIITLPEPMVEAETRRLAAALESARIRVAAVIVNRAQSSAALRGLPGIAVTAPPFAEPPAGADALRRFARTWNITA